MIVLNILFSATLLLEDFESGGIPPEWRIGNGGSPVYTWTVMEYNTHWPFEPSPSGTYYVICDSTPGVVIFDDTLISPSISLPSGLTDIFVKYKIFFMRDSADQTRGYFILRTFSSGSWSGWNTVKIYGEGEDSLFYSATDSINIFSLVQGAESLKIAFRYYRNDSLYWFIVDSVAVEAEVPVSGDVGVLSVVSPGEFFEHTVPVPVVIEVQNFSPSSINFYTKCEIRDSATDVRVYRDSLMVSLQSGEIDTISLAPFIGESEKTYKVVAFTYYSSDPNPSNDTVITYSTTHPFFGAIIESFLLPLNDSSFYDLTFLPEDTSIFVVHHKDTVFELGITGNVKNKYILTDFSSGSVEDVPFGIFYDKEMQKFWTTQLGVGLGSPEWCYAVSYTKNFNYLNHFDLKSEGLLSYNLSDAQGDDHGFISKAAFPNSYKIYKVNFSDPQNLRVDSFVFSQPIFFISGAIDNIQDTIFISAGFGDNTLFLLKKGDQIIGQRDFEGSIKGVAVERLPYLSGEYIYAYVNIGGYKIYKISTGIKWGQFVSENRICNPVKKDYVYFITPDFLRFSRPKYNVVLFDAIGRVIFTQKNVLNLSIKSIKKGTYFIKSGKRSYKIIKLR